MYKINTAYFLPDVGSTEGLAYDSVNGMLYWTSFTNSSISRIKLNDNIIVGAEKLVQLGPKDHPRAIVINSCDL